jgi:hypothetical protein
LTANAHASNSSARRVTLPTTNARAATACRTSAAIRRAKVIASAAATVVVIWLLQVKIRSKRVPVIPPVTAPAHVSYLLRDTHVLLRMNAQAAIALINSAVTTHAIRAVLVASRVCALHTTMVRTRKTFAREWSPVMAKVRVLRKLRAANAAIIGNASANIASMTCVATISAMGFAKHATCPKRQAHAQR